MIRKIGYTVVGISGEADGFSVHNLESRSSNTVGWQSPKHSIYPQEIILHLKQKSRIKTLQILSHEHLITTKIVFYTGANNAVESFERLGYVYLSNNEGNQFKSRELKSVHVDVETIYLKLLIYENHRNELNTFNQVGIISFNVLGIPVTNEKKELRDEEMTSSKLINDTPVQSNDFINSDEFTSDIVVDSDVAKIMLKLDKRKKEAADDDNFDTAKKFKQAIVDLQQIGGKLARLDYEKKVAIHKDDFDLAKSKKLEIDQVRLRIYQHLQKHELLESADLVQHLPHIKDSSLLQEVKSPSLPVSSRKASTVADHIHQVPSIYFYDNDQEATSKASMLHRKTSIQKNLSPNDWLEENYLSLSVPSIQTLADDNAMARSSSLTSAHDPSSPTPLVPSVIGPVDDESDNKQSTHTLVSLSDCYLQDKQTTMRFDTTPSDFEQTLSENNLKNKMTSLSFESNRTNEMFSTTTMKSVSHDDTVIPTHAKNRSDNSNMTMVESADLSNELPHEPKPLRNEHMRDAKSAIAVFGLHLVTCAYSKTWSFRVTALRDLSDHLFRIPESASKDEIRRNLQDAIILLKRALKDNVLAVHVAATQLLEKILVDFVLRYKLQRNDMTSILMQTLPILLERAGDAGAPRVRSCAVDFIDRMCLFPTIVKPDYHRYFFRSILTPLTRMTSPRLALSRVKIVKRLLSTHGVHEPCLGVKAYMDFCLASMKHSSGPVRTEASSIVIMLYQIVGIKLLSRLPHHEHPDRKYPIYRRLFNEFHKIDPVPFQKGYNKHLYAAEYERAEQDLRKKEMFELQQQVKKLKAMKKSMQDPDYTTRYETNDPLLYEPDRSPTMSSQHRRRSRTSLSSRRSRSSAKKKSSKNSHRTSRSRSPSSIMPDATSSVSLSKKSLLKTYTLPKDGSDPTSSKSSKDTNDEDIHKSCIFCGLHNELFDEDRMDNHYWKDCPMLMYCTYCKQVVEISALNEHLLDECPAKGQFKMCPKCKNIILSRKYQKHIDKGGCEALSSNEEHCPLCHHIVSPADEMSWQMHLMGSASDACQANPRRLSALRKRNSRR